MYSVLLAIGIVKKAFNSTLMQVTLFWVTFQAQSGRVEGGSGALVVEGAPVDDDGASVVVGTSVVVGVSVGVGAPVDVVVSEVVGVSVVVGVSAVVGVSVGTAVLDVVGLDIVVDSVVRSVVEFEVLPSFCAKTAVANKIHKRALDKNFILMAF